MSEPTLIALVQLFAMVAASGHTRLTANARSIVETYLKQYLNSEELNEYLMLYDELYSFHQMNLELEVSDKLSSSENLKNLCKKINKGLQQKDKVLVFIRFVEFLEELRKDEPDIQEGRIDLESEYLSIIKHTFNLSELDFKDIRSFILNPFDGSVSRGNLLIVSNDLTEPFGHYRYIYREKLKGTILILYLADVGLFIGRYLGNSDLYLNGHYVLPYHTFLLTHGAILKNQRIKPVYYSDFASGIFQDLQQTRIVYTAKEIEFSFKNSSNGIHPFSFTAESGELIGVMGGSGAGKSTLLNLLNGTVPLKNGSILLNGHHLSEEHEKLKGLIGYIPQDDLLMEELTVFQNLYFNARLCFDHFSSFKLKRKVLKVLDDVDLLEIRDLQVGDPLNKVISGGQRKRLNIALELIRAPFVLFADEPTSGLSSMDSEMVMFLLKKQTRKGRLVLVNIHQPSTTIFKLFDKLLILDKGGFPIYFGNPIEALTYFKTISNHVNPTESECINCGYVNPEQILQITETRTINKYGKVTGKRKTSPSKWYSLFRKMIQPEIPISEQTIELPVNSFQIPGKIKQFKIFSLRNLISKLTNKQFMLISLFEAPFLASILGYLTRYSTSNPYVFGENKNLTAYLFMSVVVALFLGMMVSAEELIKDRKILKREAFLTLSRFSYLNSKILFLFALSAVQAILYVVIGNMILDIRGMTLSYWLVLFSTSCFANMIGLNISSGLNSVVTIYILIPFILVPQLLLSGVIVPFDTLNPAIASANKVPVIGDIMTSRWAFEALAVEQFKNNRYEKPFFTYDQQLSEYGYFISYEIPALQSESEVVHRNLLLQRQPEITLNYLDILKNELTELQQHTGIAPFPLMHMLDTGGFDLQVKNQLSVYLDSLTANFSVKQQQAFKNRDQQYDLLVDKWGIKKVFELRQEYYNENLADLVLNTAGKAKLVESEGHIIRKKDPVFMEPETRNGRAHFYAPVKNVLGVKIDTLWFNIGIIWLMSVFLYFTLYYDLIRLGINYFSTRRLRKIAVD